MNKAVLSAALIALVACQPTSNTGSSARPMTDRERAIAAITEAGCQIDPSNADAVAAKTGLSDARLRAVGQELVAEGLADVSTFGIFKLTTGSCR